MKIKKTSLYLSVLALSVSLSSCSMMKSKSTQDTATQVATNVGMQVATDLMTGQKINGTKLLSQNLPQIGSLAMQAVRSGDAQKVLKYLEVFKGMGLEQKALQYILPNIFNSGLANNSQVAGQVVGILSKTLGKEKAGGLLNQAVKSIAYSKINEMVGGKQVSTKGYVMDFLGQQLPVTNLLKSKPASRSQAKQLLQKEVLNTVLAKLLTK